MGVARVRTADGHSRTVKLSEIQNEEPGSPTRAGVARGGMEDMRNVPEMGHDMTTDSPAVRRAQAEADLARGEKPTVKVKQEPPEIQEMLAQPPAPVRPEEAARVGQRDPQSGRPILQPSNNLVQNERLANQAAPELTTRLSRIAAEVDGAKFDRLRPQKGLERLQEKVAEGKPANTIGDNLAAQIVARSEKVKDQIVARLKREFPVLSVDDKFLAPRDKAGYPSANVQVRMPNGSTAEVQIVAPEVQKITDQTHRYYTLGRNYPEGSPERAWYWDQAAALHMQALERYKARIAAEQLAGSLAPGQRVVLKNGQTGKIVGFSKKFDRVTVRTSKGLRTVRPENIQARISRFDSTPARLAGGVESENVQDLQSRLGVAPKRSLSTPDFRPEALKKFTGKVESRLGAPEAQRGEIVLLNTDALHEIHKAMKDHGFAGVTLPGDIADDVIAKIRVRAEKTGREDLDSLADHLERARSQYGVVPLALEGSNEAVNISASLEERIHGAQMDMGKGLLENYGDPERDYYHPKTPLFFGWLRSRGEDPSNKMVAVAEIANLIARGDYAEAGVSEEDAMEWLDHHFATIEQVHGPQSPEQFERLIRGAAAGLYRRRSR